MEVNEAELADKPIEIARRQLCAKYGHIQCLGGCANFQGASSDGGVICLRDKAMKNMSALQAGTRCWNFKHLPALRSALPGSALVRLAQRARSELATIT